MNGDDIRSKHDRYMMPCTHQYYAEPIAVDKAEGVWVHDTDGKA